MSLDALKQAKLEAEIANLEMETLLHAENLAYAKLQTEAYRKETEDDDAEPIGQRILPFLGQVNEKNVQAAMYHLTKFAAKSDDPITIWFNSPGGLVVDGLALYDYIIAIREKGIEVTTVALGEAASMGGILLQAGTTRLIGPSAHVLIHEVSSVAIGKTSEIEDEVAYTKRLQKRLIAILAERSALSPSQIARRWKRNDWWLDADEAIELGFADGVYHP